MGQLSTMVVDGMNEILCEKKTFVVSVSVTRVPQSDPTLGTPVQRSSQILIDSLVLLGRAPRKRAVCLSHTHTVK